MSPSYKWVALSVTTVGAFMVALDTSIVILALPSVLRDLQAELAVATWTVNGYSLVLTVFLIPFGRLSDMYGRTRLYTLGFAVFTAGSALAAFAPGGLALILGRLIQGLGGTLILANSLPILVDAFPPHERGRGLGIQTIAFAVGSVSGYTLGGLLIPLGGWRAIFLINLPVGLFATFWASRHLRELAEIRPNQHYDLLGMLLLGVSLTSLLLAGTFGPSLGWAAPATLAAAGGGLLLLPLFLHAERRARDPLLELRLFRLRPFALGSIAAFLNSLAFAGLPFTLTFYLQSLRGLAPEVAAIVLTPFITAAAALGPLSGYVSDRWGARAPTTAGLLVMSAGLYAFALLPLPAPELSIMVLLALTGLGAGFFFAPNNSAVLGAVPASYRGIAAATRSTLFNLGRIAAIAIATIGLALSLAPATLHALETGANLAGQSVATQQFAVGFHILFLMFGTVNLFAALASALRGAQPTLPPPALPGWPAAPGPSPPPP